MNPKTILTEEGWDEVAPDCKGKDKELRRALMFYWSLEDDDFDFRGKALGKIAALAGTLKAANEVKGNRDAVKHLTDMIGASKVKQGELTKAKAEAEKGKALAAKAAAATQKKADADAKAREKEAEGEEGPEEDEEEQETGDYRETLLSAFKKLKSSKELEYNFIVCDAKPQVGLWMSKQLINAKHKAELTKATGGSKRFLKPGKCRVESGKLVFDMDDPPAGLAAKLRKSFKYFTGLNVGVILGDQSDEDEEGQPDAGPKAQAPAPPPRPALIKAPSVWQNTRQGIEANIGKLKAAIRKDFASEGPDMVAEVEENMKSLDRVLDKLDLRLSDVLARANNAKDMASRTAELQNAKSLITEHIKFVKAEPIIAHIDSNPFGVDTNLRKTLTASLTEVAQAIS